MNENTSLVSRTSDSPSLTAVMINSNKNAATVQKKVFEEIEVTGAYGVTLHFAALKFQLE